jgi:iron complex transport system permease protein
LFKNPLAGPSILGISDGANLGVAVVMLLFGSAFHLFSGHTVGGSLAMLLGAFLGACCILGIIIYFSTKVSSNVMLLIIGIMVGYMASSLISILNYYSTADRVHAYVMWGMGDFSGVSNERLPFFTVCTMIGLTLAFLLIKPLNALLLGEMYATNLGVKLKQTRVFILLCTGLLTATATAFCGPVSFIGLAVPHIARLLLGTSNHKLLMPVTVLTGSCMALICNMLTVLPGTNLVLPLNAVTPILGAPVIIYVIINRKNIQYFN